MDHQSENQYFPPRPRTISKKLGIALVAASFFLYGGVLLVPFTPLSTGTKIAVSAALAVSGEISFWVGGIILGREVIKKYKRYLNPLNWIKKKGI
ncbi:MAG TPA: hypothetical protein DEF36_10470 [Desulfotomaculum sp.]|nr:hypothetical protein [Desulfotomaculum sp.]